MDVRHRFAPTLTHLDAATFGLPPHTARAALAAATDAWAAGTYDPLTCDDAVARARASFARLVNVDASDVAIGHQVAPLVAIVAASLPRGSRVVGAEGDFTSLLFPLLAQGHDLVTVPLENLAEAIDARTDVVAVSAVQSADGRVADLDAIASAATHHGALTLVDGTQACGWLPLDASKFDILVAGGYKWLCHPRGTAFMSVRPERRDDLVPIAAGWYAGEHPWETCYGTPLRLAPDARRFDVSPAWLSWHAAAATFELFDELGIEAIHRHDMTLADRLRAGLHLEEAPSNSAIVSVQLDDQAGERLARAGIRSSVRAGRVRLSCHLWNDEDDVDRALGALTPATRMASAAAG